MRFSFHFSSLQVQRTKNRVQLLRKINDGDIVRVIAIKSYKTIPGQDFLRMYQHLKNTW